MPLPYRTTFTFTATTDLIALAERQLQSWLEGKRKVDPSRRSGFLHGTFFEPGRHDLGSGRFLQVAHADNTPDGVRRRLFRFVESNASGVWQVDVVAIDKHGADRNEADVLIIEAQRVDKPEADGQVDPPQLVKQLLSELPVVDSKTPVTAAAQLVGKDDIDLVIRSISDPERTVSVIVAAAPDTAPQSVSNLRKVVDSLTANVIGTVSVFLVTAEALDLLNSQLPPVLQLESGRVRTFMPKVSFSDPADALRHRVLGPLTLARSIITGHRVHRRLQDAFALQTRGAQLKAPTPREVRRHRTILTAQLAEQQRQEVVRDAVAARLESVPAPAEVQSANPLMARLRGLIKRVMGVSIEDVREEHVHEVEQKWAQVEVGAAATMADLESTERALGEVQEQLDAFVDDYEYRGLELAEAEKRASASDNEVRRLRRELASLGSGAAFSVDQDSLWETPNDLDELVLLLSPEVTDRPEITNLVVFVGDPKDVAEAHAQDAAGLDTQRVWDSVRVLFEYAEARQAGTAPGNVHTCLKSDNYGGFKIPHARHTPVETATTLGRWSDERTFDVPGLGPTVMPAHFKSGKFVRLHYFDDTGADGTGKIYIGYVGMHLPNSKTKNM